MATSHSPSVLQQDTFHEKSANPATYPIDAGAATVTNNTALPTVTTVAPVSYKIVKVRKPDGTIIKVKRPITQTTGDLVLPKPIVPTSSGSLTNAPTDKASEQASSKEVASVAPKSPTPTPRPDEKTSQLASSKVVTTTTVEVSEPTPHPDVSGKASEILKPKNAMKDSTHHLTPAKTYRLFRKGHRFRRHLTKLVGALDTNRDMGDIEDDTDDSGSYLDSDTEDSSSDNDDRHNNTTNHKKSTLGKPASYSTSVLSYADGDCEYQQSDSEDKAVQDQDVRTGKHIRSVGYALPTGHSTSHTTTHRSTPMSTQNDSSVHTREKETTTVLTPKTKVEVEVAEKEMSNGGDPKVFKARRRAARKLKRRSRITQYIVWAIMIILPVLFIVLGTFTAYLDGKSAVTRMAVGVQEAINVAISAWPIIFAAIAAQSLRALASYKIERGLRLMTLEQLISSHSVASAIKQPFFLRRWDWITIALLCLWGLSPLASQAMLRMSSSSGTGTAINTTRVTYPNTTGVNFVFGYTDDNVVGYSSETQGFYTACLMAPTIVQDEPQDLWNNTRIPSLELMKSLGSADSDGWYAIDVDSYSETDIKPYSSLLGIPLNSTWLENLSLQYYLNIWDNLDDLESLAGFETTVNTSYLVLNNCSPLIHKTMPDIIQEVNRTGEILYSSPSGTLYMSMHLFNQPPQVTSSPGNGGSSASNMLLPGSVTFASKVYVNQSDSSVTLYAYSVCGINQTFVDSHFECQGLQCTVDKMRYTIHPPSSLAAITPSFIRAFVNATSPYDGGYTLTERYIAEPSAALEVRLNTTFDISAGVKLPFFEQRLGLLLNTFWQSGFTPTTQTAGLAGAPFAPLEFMFESTAVASYNTTTQDIWVANWAWVTVLMFSSVVLLSAGVASAILDSRVIGPDILGFASSITRHNKYMDLPKGDSTMGGAERARMLCDVKVMMQDVKAGSKVGKIALGTMSEGAQRLKPERLYH